MTSKIQRHTDPFVRETGELVLMTHQPDRDVLRRQCREFIACMVDAIPELLCICLEGSHARGEALSTSDYDFLILTNRLTGNGIQRISRVLSAFPDFDVYVTTPQEIHRFPPASRWQFDLDIAPHVVVYGEWPESIHVSHSDVVLAVADNTYDALTCLRTLLLGHADRTLLFATLYYQLKKLDWGACRLLVFLEEGRYPLLTTEVPTLGRLLAPYPTLVTSYHSLATTRRLPSRDTALKLHQFCLDLLSFVQTEV